MWTDFSQNQRSFGLVFNDDSHVRLSFMIVRFRIPRRSKFWSLISLSQSMPSSLEIRNICLNWERCDLRWRFFSQVHSKLNFSRFMDYFCWDSIFQVELILWPLTVIFVTFARFHASFSTTSVSVGNWQRYYQKNLIKSLETSIIISNLVYKKTLFLLFLSLLSPFWPYG